MIVDKVLATADVGTTSDDEAMVVLVSDPVGTGFVAITDVEASTEVCLSGALCDSSPVEAVGEFEEDSSFADVEAVEAVEIVEIVEAVEATLALADVAVCEVAEFNKDEELEQERSYNGVVLSVVPTTPKLGLGVVG